jgi:hypothetical protein
MDNEQKIHALQSLTIKLIDRWWPFVHEARFASTTSKALFEEAQSALHGDAIIPLDMVLYCPRCGKQHIDKDNSEELRIEAAERGIDREGDRELEQWLEEREWLNPPHRSHLCHFCKCIWRPADFPTNGVASISTKGSKDDWNVHPEIDTNPPVTAKLAEMMKLMIGKHYDQMDETHLSKELIDKLNRLYKSL